MPLLFLSSPAFTLLSQRSELYAQILPLHSSSLSLSSKSSVPFSRNDHDTGVAYAPISYLCSRRHSRVAESLKWRTRVSFFAPFFSEAKDSELLKEELLEAIAPLDRGAAATPQDQERIDQIARKLEALNKIKEPLKSNLLNGKWELLYTTSQSILKTKWPKFLRPSGKIFQAINVDTLRAQNMETWPFFNQATANLIPINTRRVAVKFDSFKIVGLMPTKSRGSGRGQLEITYLDEELRISRGNQGNLFVLRMFDPFYRVPV